MVDGRVAEILNQILKLTHDYADTFIILIILGKYVTILNILVYKM